MQNTARKFLLPPKVYHAYSRLLRAAAERLSIDEASYLADWSRRRTVSDVFATLWSAIELASVQDDEPLAPNAREDEAWMRLPRFAHVRRFKSRNGLLPLVDGMTPAAAEQMSMLSDAGAFEVPPEHWVSGTTESATSAEPTLSLSAIFSAEGGLLGDALSHWLIQPETLARFSELFAILLERAFADEEPLAVRAMPKLHAVGPLERRALIDFWNMTRNAVTVTAIVPVGPGLAARRAPVALAPVPVAPQAPVADDGEDNIYAESLEAAEVIARAAAGGGRSLSDYLVRSNGGAAPSGVAPRRGTRHDAGASRESDDAPGRGELGADTDGASDERDSEDVRGSGVSTRGAVADDSEESRELFGVARNEAFSGPFDDEVTQRAWGAPGRASRDEAADEGGARRSRVRQRKAFDAEPNRAFEAFDAAASEAPDGARDVHDDDDMPLGSTRPGRRARSARKSTSWVAEIPTPDATARIGARRSPRRRRWMLTLAVLTAAAASVALIIDGRDSGELTAVLSGEAWKPARHDPPAPPPAAEVATPAPSIFAEPDKPPSAEAKAKSAAQSGDAPKPRAASAEHAPAADVQPAAATGARAAEPELVEPEDPPNMEGAAFLDSAPDENPEAPSKPAEATRAAPSPAAPQAAEAKPATGNAAADGVDGARPQSIIVRSRPKGASVYRAQVKLGETPLSVGAPAPGEKIALDFKLPGYVGQRLWLSDASSADVMIKLQAVRPAKRARLPKVTASR